MKKSHFRYWELALLLALAVTILWGAASLGQQEELGRKVIRLHVIANSDSPEDQALKLRVRDRVLARAQEILEQSADMEQAEQALPEDSEVFTIRRQLSRLGADAACMTGSGSAVMGLFRREETARLAARELEKSYPLTFLAPRL